MTLYYRHVDRDTIREWCYVDEQRVDLGTYRLGPSWKRWLSGNAPLCVTLVDGRVFEFDEMEEACTD